MRDPFTQVAQDASQPAGTLKSWVGRHPYVSALLIFVYFETFFLLLHFFLNAVIKVLHLPFLQYTLIGEVLLALVVAVPIIVLGWWSEAGFTRGINGRGVVVCIMPIVLVVLPVLLGLPAIVGRASISMIITTAALVLLVGFVEEGLCRGLLLRSLLPGGIWVSVLLSSLLFAGLHLANILSGLPWNYVAGQLLIAFGSGVLFAAIRLRTRSIWPSLLMHAAHDFPGILLLAIEPDLALSVSLNLALIVNGVFCALFLLNALVLLRPGQVQRLRIVYGLAPIAPPSGTPLYQLPPYPGYEPEPH
ncbi:MAG: lysostaphin resistance A-like protein, partial [Ktedonobacteraceae bacterium]